MGLVPKRERATLAAFLDGYISSRHDVKPGTTTNLRQVRDSLVEHFGPDKPLRDITPGDADGYRLGWLGRNWRKTRSVGGVAGPNSFSRRGQRRWLVSSNPFADLKSAIQANPSRFYFVTREENRRSSTPAPTPNGGFGRSEPLWRLAMPHRTPGAAMGRRGLGAAASRFGAQRRSNTPEGSLGRCRSSRSCGRTWKRSGSKRGPGAEQVITRYRDTNANLRTQLLRIIGRAGVQPWPKLFQNLRSTRETELAEEFPLHVVCQWIGNSQPVARSTICKLPTSISTGGKDRFGAAQKGWSQRAQRRQCRAEWRRKARATKKTKDHVSLREKRGVLRNCAKVQVTPTGLEPVLPA